MLCHDILVSEFLDNFLNILCNIFLYVCVQYSLHVVGYVHVCTKYIIHIPFILLKHVWYIGNSLLYIDCNCQEQ